MNTQPTTPQLEELASMPKLDAHAHLLGGVTLDDASALASLLARHAMRWMSICWYVNDDSLARQKETARRVCARHPDRFSWVTTFPLSGFDRPGWTERAIASIDEGRATGAVGVKVWKNVGMELRDADGRWVMVDDPRLSPVVEHVRSLGMTLAAHIGEPRNCWLPIEEMTVEGDRAYFQGHPEYHGIRHPEMPGYWEQVAARDRLLEHNPGLRVVGCHLGSLEFDVAEVARRLDRFPSFAVDLSARVCHLQAQPTAAVRAFLLAYQDRILYGTDLGWEHGGSEADADRRQQESVEARYRADYRYFAGSGVMDAPDVRPGFRCEALALPMGVLRKIFHDNARCWYPLLS